MQVKEVQCSRTARSAELEAVHSAAHVAIMLRKTNEDAPCVVADSGKPSDNSALNAQVKEIQCSRAAGAAELEAVHSAAHVATMRRKAKEDAPCVVADFEEPPDNTTYMAESSFDDALKVCRAPMLPRLPWSHRERFQNTTILSTLSMLNLLNPLRPLASMPGSLSSWRLVG
jgi:hypothetical protein